MTRAQEDGRATKKRGGEERPFPTGQMITLAICKFSEPLAFNSVLAYAYIMVKDELAKNSSFINAANASFYAGLLVSTYAFGEVPTALLWGALSDRIGRKPVVLSGLVGVAVSCLMLGLAKQYWVALLARLVGGMLNGNVAVMQTMLAEAVKYPEHEPTAYAIHPFVWFAGGILGSAMGGYLAQPAHFYPHMFSPDGLFATYPYLLPNIVCIVGIAIAVIQGIIFLKETNPLLIEKEDLKRAAGRKNDETTPLLTKTAATRGCKDADYSEVAVEEGSEQSTRINHHMPRKPSELLEEGLLSEPDPQDLDLRRSSFGTTSALNSEQQKFQPPPKVQEARLTQKPNWRTTFNFTVVMLIASLGMCSYHSMGYANTLPIYLLDKPRHPPSSKGVLDLLGGLGYNIHEVGTFMAVNGFMAVAVQGLVFPPLVSRVGVYKAWISMVLLYPFAYSLIPLLTLLAPGAPRSAGIYIVMLMQNVLNIIIPPCALILIKNATPSPLVLGTVNGACMSLLSFARTVAPPLQGVIYAAGGSAASWWSLAGISILGIVQLFWVPREKALAGMGWSYSDLGAGRDERTESNGSSDIDEDGIRKGSGSSSNTTASTTS